MENGTLIVPGHGRLSDVTDVAYYRDMVTIIRDRVQDMISKRASLDQVKAAKLTRDYDGIYAADAARYSPDQFIEAVYRSLSTSASSTTAKPAPGQKPAPPAGQKPAPPRK